MKVAVLGPEGTYTHEAADRYFEDSEFVFYSTIRDVFEADESVKFVPVENSLGGEVAETVDLLRETHNQVTGEYRMPIKHVLISDSDISDIEKVCSHPQALSQTRDFLDNRGWGKVQESSTAAAVENLKEGEAAIASRIAAKVYSKDILEESVQDQDTNKTRFFELNGESASEEKTALILEPQEDRPGLLHAMLSCFAGHQVNLSHIQSRPTRKELGDYYFYIETEAAREELEPVIRCLETYAEVDLLGSFDVVTQHKV